MSRKICDLLCTQDGTAKLLFVWVFGLMGFSITMKIIGAESSWTLAAIAVIIFVIIPIKFNSWRERYCKEKCMDTEYVSGFDSNSPGYFLRQMQRDKEAKELEISPIENDIRHMLVEEAIKYAKDNNLLKDKVNSTGAFSMPDTLKKELEQAAKQNPDVPIDEWLAEVKNIISKMKDVVVN